MSSLRACVAYATEQGEADTRKSLVDLLVDWGTPETAGKALAGLKPH